MIQLINLITLIGRLIGIFKGPLIGLLNLRFFASKFISRPGGEGQAKKLRLPVIITNGKQSLSR